MKLAEKLTTIAQNVPRVYDAGRESAKDEYYDKGYADGQSSVVDESKIIEKSVTGSGIVSLNDVSEIPHSVGVKVEGRNLISSDFLNINNWENLSVMTEVFPLSLPVGKYYFSAELTDEKGTYLYVQRSVKNNGNWSNYKNLITENLNEDDWLINIEDGYDYRWLVSSLDIETVFDRITNVKLIEDMSRVEVRQYGKNRLDIANGYEENQNIMVQPTENGFEIINSSVNQTEIYYPFSVNSNTYSVRAEWTLGFPPRIMKANRTTLQTLTNGISYTFTPTDDVFYFRITVKAFETATITFAQLEMGTPTPYEPYNEHTFTPNADGTVDGVESISPNMNIMTDKAVDITVDYWKSYGMQLEYDRFWDSAQSTSIQAYMYAGGAWNDYTFNPKNDIVSTGGTMVGMFAQTGIVDLKGVLETLDRVLDTSKSNNVSNFLYYAQKTKYAPKLDFSSATTANACFYACLDLISIDEVVSSEKTTWTNSFYRCEKLKHIIFSGAIGTNIDFSYSPLLTVESLLSILTSLSKDASIAKGKTATFSTESQSIIENNPACAEQLSLAVGAGWSVGYVKR